MKVYTPNRRNPVYLNENSEIPVYKPAGEPQSYFRKAILPSEQAVIFKPSARNWAKAVKYTEIEDQFGLHSIGMTYDECPIFVVPPELYTEVCASFTKGNYGLDTESDYRTQELRLIQVSNGFATYIFKADSLKVDSQMGLPKFLKAKDRIKIGVDIETDARRINKHCNAWIEENNQTFYRKRFEVGGIIDLQNISRALTTENPPISLKNLIKAYLPEFNYIDGKHDSYLNPTVQQYIYAANDAVSPLQIYFRMMNKH